MAYSIGWSMCSVRIRSFVSKVLSIAFHSFITTTIKIEKTKKRFRQNILRHTG